MSAPPDARPTRPPPFDFRRAGVAITAVFFCHGLLFASWTAHIPHLKQQLHLSTGTLGLVLLAAPIGSVSAMLLCGYLVPRLGSRRMVRLTMIGYCATGPVVGLAGSASAFFVAFMAWGAFQGALDVSMNAQAIGVERRSHRPRMPGFHGGWSVGSLTGALLGALSVGIGVALGTQLLVLGTAVLVVLGWLTTRLLPDQAPAGGAGRSRPGWWHRQDRGTRVLRPVIVVLGLVALADMLCEGAAADWASVYFRDSLRTTAFVAGSAYVVYLLAMATVRLSGNRLVVQLARTRLVPALLVVGAVGFAVGLAVDRPWAVLVGFGCLGAGLALVVPTVFTAAGAVPGVHPGRGVAAVSAFGWAGFVAGPPLIGLLASISSLRAALVLVPVLAGGLAVATAIVLRPRPPL